jgi:hypothetical protein
MHGETRETSGETGGVSFRYTADFFGMFNEVAAGRLSAAAGDIFEMTSRTTGNAVSATGCARLSLLPALPAALQAAH